ncbi:MAG: hypothetical protein GC162_17025 [Planctomycetes bacterium]|nr:hypothetical protein [Planctomycetota bacterium]
MTGGTGWTGQWGASTISSSNTSRIKIDADNNLTYSGGGYNVPQTGVGLAYGDFNGFRGINRYINTDLVGQVWFSILVKNTSSNFVSGIEFNNHADAPFGGTDYAQGAFDVGLFGTSLNVRYNSVNTTGVATLALNAVHLIVGHIVIGAGNDTLQVWADPANLASLGTPLFSASSANMGNALYLAGIYAYGNVTSLNGQVDALRLADGPNAFANVTGVPEPSSFALLAVLAAPLLRRRARR